jgi:hypothetical protein
MNEENDIETEATHCEVEDCTSCESVDLVNKLGVMDVVLSKAISRKLFVFLVATGLLVWADLDPDTWGLIAMIYVGGQSVIDTVKVWKNGEQI